MKELLLKLMNDLQILKGIKPKQEEPAVQSFTPYENFSMIDDVEMLMKDNYTFLRKFSRIPFGVHQRLCENINEELSEYINCPNWNRPTFYDDGDEYTIIYRKTKAITPDLPNDEPNNSLSMGDEHLNTILETEKFSVENLVPIPSEFKGISEDICDVPSYDYFDAECGLINSLLSRDISITSPKIDFLPEEFVGELDFIDPILPGIDEDDCDVDDFDKEEGEIDIDILQIEDEILHGYHDSEGDILYLESLLSDNTTLSLPPKLFLDHDPRSLSDSNDLKSIVRISIKKDKIKAKTNKSEHENGKRMKNRGQRRTHVLWTNTGPLNGPGSKSQGQSLANYAWRSINGLDQMLGGQSRIEGPRLKVGERPRGLEASSHAYIKSLSHTEVV
ncbi:hypothetical protein Tco_0348835 [Tanacetum coccineum]